MKVPPRDIPGFLSSPPISGGAALLYGPDPSRTALKRADLLGRLLGEKGEEEMRLTRLSGADHRKDAAVLPDALKAQGFFPGQRVVYLEDAGDGNTKGISSAMEDWVEGDAYLVVTAGQLAPRSSLRKFFEGHRSAASIAIYADPPSRAEIEALFERYDLQSVPDAAMRTLTDLSRSLEPGEFRQLVEKLSLYKVGDPNPVSDLEILLCQPAEADADLDEVVQTVADGSVDQLAEVLPKLAGAGTNPTTSCISAQRYFKSLLTICCHPEGAERGIGGLRPPVFGPRRDRMLRHARKWGRNKTEAALAMILDTDLQLRSSNPAPQSALVERLFIRIAMIANR